jgi:phosphonate metabolism protein (transferase hexapeptide repeat family)
MPKLGDEPYLHDRVKLTDAKLGRFVELGEGTRIIESTLGDYSYTDRYADIAYASIGKFANIAAFSRINPSEHPYHRASLHHFMYRSSYYWENETDETAVFDWRRSRPVAIGHDSWIGHSAVVMKGVTIGNGAIVGSKSTVTKDVAPFAVVAGSPAQLIKWRHPQDVAEKLQALAWWDWSHEKIHAALPDFRALSAEAFLEKYQ